MKVWVDTTTGTWGLVEHKNGNLLIVDLDKQAKRDTLAGEAVDGYSLLAYLEDCTDGEVVDYAYTHGHLAK